jgi:hypothetical protein
MARHLDYEVILANEKMGFSRAKSCSAQANNDGFAVEASLLALLPSYGPVLDGGSLRSLRRWSLRAVQKKVGLVGTKGGRRTRSALRATHVAGAFLRSCTSGGRSSASYGTGGANMCADAERVMPNRCPEETVRSTRICAPQPRRDRRSTDLTSHHQGRRTPPTASPAKSSAPQRFPLSLLRNVLDLSLHCAVDQRTQDRTGIGTARGSHADRLSKNAGG